MKLPKIVIDFKWIIIWIILTIGEPDIIDAIVHLLMK